MTILAEVYASAPADQILIETIELNIAGTDPLRFVAAYEDMQLGVDGKMVTFKETAMQPTLPKMDNTGNQSIAIDFGADPVVAQEAFEAIQAANGKASIIYRSYLSSDASTPAQTITMSLIDLSINGMNVTVHGGYFDLLGVQWPRLVYTTTNAPGIKYL